MISSRSSAQWRSSTLPSRSSGGVSAIARAAAAAAAVVISVERGDPCRSLPPPPPIAMRPSDEVDEADDIIDAEESDGAIRSVSVPTERTTEIVLPPPPPRADDLPVGSGLMSSEALPRSTASSAWFRSRGKKRGQGAGGSHARGSSTAARAARAADAHNDETRRTRTSEKDPRGGGRHSSQYPSSPHSLVLLLLLFVQFVQFIG